MFAYVTLIKNFHKEWEKLEKQKERRIIYEEFMCISAVVETTFNYILRKLREKSILIL